MSPSRSSSTRKPSLVFHPAVRAGLEKRLPLRFLPGQALKHPLREGLRLQNRAHPHAQRNDSERSSSGPRLVMPANPATFSLSRGYLAVLHHCGDASIQRLQNARQAYRLGARIGHRAEDPRMRRCPNPARPGHSAGSRGWPRAWLSNRNMTNPGYAPGRYVRMPAKIRVERGDGTTLPHTDRGKIRSRAPLRSWSSTVTASMVLGSSRGGLDVEMSSNGRGDEGGAAFLDQRDGSLGCRI